MAYIWNDIRYLQVHWEYCLRADDRTREVARRKGMWHLAQLRDWTRCRWCMEEVPMGEFSLGRLCGHQYHNVSSGLNGYGKDGG